jgi:hypothetical protein
VNAGLVDRIRLGWIVLAEAEDPSAGGITSRPLTEAGDRELLLGRDGAGVPCLLIPIDEPGPQQRVGVVTVANRVLATPAGEGRFVVVACSDPSLRDVFDHFLVGVVSALGSVGSLHPSAAVIEVLAHWKSLFRGGSQSLGATDLAALIAELLVLEEVVGRDPERSLEVWRGPSEQRHDLRRGDHAIEVKSTLSHTLRRITVNGVDQLEAPSGGTLTLAWHRLEPVPDGGLSVFVVADRLIAAGASAVDLYLLLEAAGSPPSTREAHDAVRFELRERRLFGVDDGFPRIVADTFPDGVPVGVDDLIYKAMLPDDSEALGDVAISLVFDRLAGVA